MIERTKNKKTVMPSIPKEYLKYPQELKNDQSSMLH